MTLLDVVEASGLSVSTVSIVLSDTPPAKNVAANIMRGLQNGLQAAGYLPLVMDAQTQRSLFDTAP